MGIAAVAQAEPSYASGRAAKLTVALVLTATFVAYAARWPGPDSTSKPQRQRVGRRQQRVRSPTRTERLRHWCKRRPR